MGLTNTSSYLLPGTLELLILKALVNGAKHGYAMVLCSPKRWSPDEAPRPVAYLGPRSTTAYSYRMR